MRLPFSWLDWFAVVVLAVCFVGYSWYSRASRRSNLSTVTDDIRLQWMRRALAREVKILDSTLLANLSSSATFFSSTSMLILGGLVAMLGTVERSVDVVQSLPFALKSSAQALEIKALAMIVLFTYAFLRFTWALRQNAYVALLLGAMPEHDQVTAADDAFAIRAAKLNQLSGENYTHGLRAYYFALPILVWMVHPLLCIAATVGVTAVLYRMEFHSRTLDALLPEIKPRNGSWMGSNL